MQPELTPITEADRHMMTMPTIASQMPVRFSNGAIWEHLSGDCKVCRRQLPDRHLTGRITQIVPTMVTVEAIGICGHCRTATRYHYRLHDDMRITGPTDQGWATWHPKRSLAQRIARHAAKLFRC